MGWLRIGSIGLLTGTLWGCTSAGVFECQVDAQCQLGGDQGVCESEGFCSFPDPSCESGMKYGIHAGLGLSNICVPVYGSTSGDSTPDGKFDTEGNSVDTGSGDEDTFGWQYYREVTISSSSDTNLSNAQVMVELNTQFSYNRTAADGADLRFTTSPTSPIDRGLAYYIETWNPGETSKVWVQVPSIPANGTTTIYMFYGNPTADAASEFEATFPDALVSTDDVSLGGEHTYDWFELSAADTLTIEPGRVLTIQARNVIIAGTVVGTGAGHAGGETTPKDGGGPGGGGDSTDAGGGGGGYGGQGGQGGFDPFDNPGQGGVTNGSSTSTKIRMGSGGGGTDLRLGGAGGGALSLLARDVTVSGNIVVDGAPGEGLGESIERGGGGGAGGGVLIFGFNVTVTGSISARGGDGGNQNSSNNDNDGGGGGGGGRVKLFYENDLVNRAIINVRGGPGGVFGDVSVAGDGEDGSIHEDGSYDHNTEVSVGFEMSVP